MTLRYGELVALAAPGAPVLLVTDPGAVRQVLQTGSRHWTKDTVQYRTLATVTGPGLLANPGPGWIERRRVVAPAFHHQRLDGVVDAVRAGARGVLREWDELPRTGGLVDVSALAARSTLDVVGHTLFAHDLGPDTAALVAATDAAAELIVMRAGSPVPGPRRATTGRRLREARASIDRICRGVVTARRQRGVEEGDDDLLGLLLAAGLSDDDVRDELVTMVVAGHETVAAALTWTLWLLARHPEAQSRLREEVRSSAARAPRRDSGELPWTRAVVDEALRLYPPAWVLTRRASQPDLLAGQPVPAGTLAIISPWLVHRRAASWPDADVFRPERFLDQGTAARADYLPFGLGPRLCIGRDFALVELTVLLAELLREHRVAVPEGAGTIEREVFVTVRPRGGLRLHVAPVQ